MNQTTLIDRLASVTFIVKIVKTSMHGQCTICNVCAVCSDERPSICPSQ